MNFNCKKSDRFHNTIIHLYIAVLFCIKYASTPPPAPPRSRGGEQKRSFGSLGFQLYCNVVRTAILCSLIFWGVRSPSSHKTLAVVASAFPVVTSVFTFQYYAQAVVASAFPVVTSVFTFQYYAQAVVASAFPVVTSAFTFQYYAQAVVASAFPVVTSAFTFQYYDSDTLAYTKIFVSRKTQLSTLITVDILTS
ncbi:hypothetical protein JYQ62_20910 [Nostoc sp. UHCC 0702]|nr:hypothetical protein JYQ62_20910 [Nostoc sp. UHCC 0702]